MKSFASDNNSGVHPDVLAALAASNDGHAVGYGDDPWTASANARFDDLFGREVDVLFVWNGTGANVVGLGSILRPFEAVICTANAHIHVDETGAPEGIIGVKLIDLPTPDGKLRPADIEAQVHAIGVPHHSQPKVVSITQSTEVGTLYTPDEVRAIADTAHAHGLYLHMDGARIANATAALDCDVADITCDAGVDVMSFGGTKNGMMYGEAVVYFDRSFAATGQFFRKHATQLPSKCRFVSAQFGALLSDDLWLRNARHSNAMAKLLAARVRDIPGVRLTREPEVNSVFAVLERRHIEALMARHFFYIWDEHTNEVRWMTSFDTTEADIDAFATSIAEVTASDQNG
ncbi:MAG: low specificity L-threonine aldolase [Acidimicrobiia bacterium]